MKSIGIFNRRSSSLVAATAMLLSVVAPSLVFSSASADQLTGRKIELSSSAAGATDVDYKVTFTATESAAGYVIDFCSNSPLLGMSCVPPTGMSTASPTASGATVVDGPAAPTTNTSLEITQAITAGPVTTEVSGITNPTTAGPLYARIYTYEDMANAAVSSNPGTTEDNGAVALSITNKIGVSAAVLETMTFCVSKTDTSSSGHENCLDLGDAEDLPNIQLGEESGGVKALQTGIVSKGTIWTQISTNAVAGAVVSMKINNQCGGLKLAGVSSPCSIAPAISGSIVDNGPAKFGVKTGTAVASADITTAQGTYQPATGSGYGDSSYFMGFVDGDDGVTSTYGDPVLDTNGAPINNMNMPLEFAATITNQTPAGLYSADLNMIASGTF